MEAALDAHLGVAQLSALARVCRTVRDWDFGADATAAEELAEGFRRQRAEERQLALSKSLFALGFLSLLLGSVGVLYGSEGIAPSLSAPLLELPVLSMVAAFGCLRDSGTCRSSPRKCTRFLWSTVYLHCTLLLLLSSALALYAAELAHAPACCGFAHLSLFEKLQLCTVVALILVHGHRLDTP